MTTLVTYLISATVALAVAYPVLVVIRDTLGSLAIAM